MPRDWFAQSVGNPAYVRERTFASGENDNDNNEDDDEDDADNGNIKENGNETTIINCVIT